jgi:hypothetical protein
MHSLAHNFLHALCHGAALSLPPLVTWLLDAERSIIEAIVSTLPVSLTAGLLGYQFQDDGSFRGILSEAKPGKWRQTNALVRSAKLAGSILWCIFLFCLVLWLIGELTHSLFPTSTLHPENPDKLWWGNAIYAYFNTYGPGPFILSAAVGAVVGVSYCRSVSKRRWGQWEQRNRLISELLDLYGTGLKLASSEWFPRDLMSDFVQLIGQGQAQIMAIDRADYHIATTTSDISKLMRAKSAYEGALNSVMARVAKAGSSDPIAE